MSFFDRWFSKKKGAPVQDCPKKGDICIYVYRLDTGDPVQNVKVSLGGTSSGQTPTDGNGFAEFLDRDPGEHQFGIALPGSMAHYKIEPYGPDVSVSAGGIATATVAVYPTGKLSVQVLDDLNRAVTETVTIDATGPETHQKRVQNGVHQFADLMCGSYDVTATGPSHLFDPYQGSALKVVVPDGGTGAARIVLKLLNIVDPEIKADEHEIWFLAPPTEEEKQAAAAQQGGQAQGSEPKPPEDKPVHLRVSYRESRPEKPFQDAGTLTFAGAQVEVFIDKDCKTAFPLDQNGSARINNQRLKAGLDLYVRGKSEGSLTATLALDKPRDETIRVQGPVQELLEVKAENVVTPKIEVEYKVVLADPDLAKHQDAKKSDGTTDEEKIVADRVTYIEVSGKARGATPKYTKGGKLEVTAGADKVKLYSDMRRTQELTRPLTNAELFGERPFIVYVQSEKDKEGDFKLKLTLDPSGDPHIHVKEMKDVEMAVVKLDLKLHQHKDGIVDEEFDADKDTLDDYFTALKDKVIPDQEVMTDEKQVKPGRLLHKQKDGHHGRAKLLLKKITAAWPAGTDDYYVIVDQECDSGGISLWDKETEGDKKDLPFKVKVKDLKANDVELWVEGTETTKLWRDVVLGAGIDRDEGGLSKEPKHNGDWARFTVVEVKEVKLDYTATAGQPNAWDDTDKRFYVNYKAGLDGRKIKLKAELTEKLKDVPLHFMLAPHKDNGKKDQLGEDLPATWKWKDIEEAVKHKDRSAQKKLLHLSKKTDADGKAEYEVHLSRIGGQVFEPACYVTQDPHLAKYVQDHADLGKRKPVRAAHTITVWRRFAYQKVTVTGRNYPATAPSEAVYERVKAKMLERPAKNYTQDEVRAMALPALYPEYNFKVNGGNGVVLNVSDANTGQFFADINAETEHPIKVPIVTCDYNWGLEQDSAPATGLDNIAPAAFPVAVDTNVYVCDPPLQGGNLLVSGDWEAADWDPAADGGNGDWVNFRSGSFVDGEITVDPNRGNLKQVHVALPAGIGAVTADTSVDIKNLVVKGAGDFFLGGYNIDGNQRIVCVYDPNDAQDYQNTVVHELGHAFHQTLGVAPATGIPVNPNYILNPTGPHCTYDTNKCVMFTSGPIAGSLNRYCPDCHPHMLVQDMQTIA